jgi:hypothetical protein
LSIAKLLDFIPKNTIGKIRRWLLLGIAKALSKKGGTYVVCNYDPAGNYLGQFPQNIGKPN